MGSSLDTVTYIADQAGLGKRLSHRKMFGEFALYVDGKVVALVCDDQLFLKPTDECRAYLGTVREAPPFPGAKNFFLLSAEIDDPDRLGEALQITARALPEGKPKRAKNVAKPVDRGMSTTAATPDEYVKLLDGWRLALVRKLRKAVRGAAKLEETLKWGHLVYLANGPVLMIRAERKRVLFGFWRGQRLRDIEPRLKPGGRYEMATLALAEGEDITATLAARLTKQAVALNRKLGNPQKDIAKKIVARKRKTR